MRVAAPVFACLLCAGHGLRLQSQLAESGEMVDASGGRGEVKVTQLNALARLLLEHDSASAFAPGPVSGLKGGGAASSARADVSMAAAEGLKLANQVGAAAGWMSGIRTPAALVAGASLSAGYSLDKDLEPRKGDKRWVSVLKKVGKLLYVSAFALEIACVFSSTVTGTMLLGRGVPNPLAASPLDMLHREAEFEYLLCRILFFQGLLNWLSAVAMHQALPRKGISKAAQKLHFSKAAAISAVVLYMVAFYNRHISYYANYGAMIVRLVVLFAMRMYGGGVRLLPALALVPTYLAVKQAWDSVRDVDNKELFMENKDEEEEET